MNAMNINFLQERSVMMVPYAANRTDEIEGKINLISTTTPNALDEETTRSFISKLRVEAKDGKVIPVIYGRTGYFSVEDGYRMDIRIQPSEKPTHWLVVSEDKLRSAGRPFEVDFFYSEDFQALAIPIAKAYNILTGQLQRGGDPLLA